MTTADPTPTPPRQADAAPVASTVCAMFAEVLETPVHPHDELQHLHSIDSLKLMRLICTIEDRFAISIEDESFFQASTVADLIHIVETARNTPS